MASTDYGAAQLATVDPAMGEVDSIPAAQLFDVGGASTTTYYTMMGIDTACAPGTDPHIWTVTGSPDPTGALAGALPCGGPLGAIWIGAKFEV